MNLHPSGLPAAAGQPPCASCAWGRPGPGGVRCIAVGNSHDDEPVLPSDQAGCAFWEQVPSCDPCGACCREAFDSVPVTDDDQATLRRRPEWVVSHPDGWRDLRRVPSPTGCGTRCAALRGDGDKAPFRCVIYADRPAACSELERGSWNCLFARRRAGVSPTPPARTPVPPADA